MSLGNKIALTALLVAAIGTVASWLAIREVREWIRKHKVLFSTATLLSLCCLFLFLTWPIRMTTRQSEIRRYSLSGVVVNKQSNEGVGQAQVLIGDTKTRTDDTGNFSISLGPSSRHERLTVRVSKEGFDDCNWQVDLPIQDIVIPLSRK